MRLLQEKRCGQNGHAPIPGFNARTLSGKSHAEQSGCGHTNHVNRGHTRESAVLAPLYELRQSKAPGVIKSG